MVEEEIWKGRCVMKHSEALIMAEWLIEEFKPGCVRIEIAGGLRRGKEDVHDIEIIAVPNMISDKNMFGETISNESELDKRLRWLEELGALKKVKGGEKFKQFQIGRWEEFGLKAPDVPFKLDLFLVTPPASWGVQFVIRTGPAEFSQWMVTKKLIRGALPDIYYVKGGAVWNGENGLKFDMPEEIDFFKLCGMEWIEPSQRVARWKK